MSICAPPSFVLRPGIKKQKSPKAVAERWQVRGASALSRSLWQCVCGCVNMFVSAASHYLVLERKGEGNTSWWKKESVGVVGEKKRNSSCMRFLNMESINKGDDYRAKTPQDRQTDRWGEREWERWIGGCVVLCLPDCSDDCSTEKDPHWIPMELLRQLNTQYTQPSTPLHTLSKCMTTRINRASTRGPITPSDSHKGNKTTNNTREWR